MADPSSPSRWLSGMLRIDSETVLDNLESNSDTGPARSDRVRSRLSLRHRARGGRRRDPHGPLGGRPDGPLRARDSDSNGGSLTRTRPARVARRPARDAPARSARGPRLGEAPPRAGPVLHEPTRAGPQRAHLRARAFDPRRRRVTGPEPGPLRLAKAVAGASRGPERRLGPGSRAGPAEGGAGRRSAGGSGGGRGEGGGLVGGRARAGVVTKMRSPSPHPRSRRRGEAGRPAGFRRRRDHGPPLPMPPSGAGPRGGGARRRRRRRRRPIAGARWARRAVPGRRGGDGEVRR